MPAVCPTCGLPDDLCVCEDLSKSSQQISVSIDERRFGKEVTVLEGFDQNEIDLEDLASELKGSLACGGTTHEDTIELQGNHRDQIDSILTENGFEIR